MLSKYRLGALAVSAPFPGHSKCEHRRGASSDNPWWQGPNAHAGEGCRGGGGKGGADDEGFRESLHMDNVLAVTTSCPTFLDVS